MPIENGVEDSAVLCAICLTDGGVFNPIDRYEVEGVTIPLCDECRDRRYTSCDYCSDLMPWNQGTEVWQPVNSSYAEDEDDRDPPNLACGNCAENDDRFMTCRRCSHLYDRDSGSCCGGDYRQSARNPLPHIYPHCGCLSVARCEVASAANERPSAVDMERASIQYYSYKPEPVFRGERKPGQAFFGLELELTAENPDRLAAEAAALLGEHVYMKQDSSISRGFELVTHPMTYQWAMDEFSWQGFEILAGRGIGSDDSTGMHIHVSKSGFGKASHDLKWLTFWYQNRRAIEKIARRRNSTFASFDNAHERKYVVGLKKEGVVRCNNCDSCSANRRERSDYYRCRAYLERYSAINLTNSQTYEARVFASSTNSIHIRGAIALMASTIEYTRQLTANAVIKRDGYAWSAFLEWVAADGRYQPLLDCIAYIDQNGRN